MVCSTALIFASTPPLQDNKLKHMAELQLSVVSEPESRRQIGAQIAAWEENLERLHCEQFRLRCYMASLQHGELPNPKVLACLELLLDWFSLSFLLQFPPTGLLLTSR